MVEAGWGKPLQVIKGKSSRSVWNMGFSAVTLWNRGGGFLCLSSAGSMREVLECPPETQLPPTDLSATGVSCIEPCRQQRHRYVACLPLRCSLSCTGASVCAAAL